MNSLDTILKHKAKLIRLHKDVAYYAVTVPYCELLYSFPVPLKDMPEKMILAEKNALHFSQHISKAIHNGTFLKEAA